MQLDLQSVTSTITLHKRLNFSKLDHTLRVPTSLPAEIHVLTKLNVMKLRTLIALSLSLLLFSAVFGQSTTANTGIFQSYIVIDVNNTGNQFLAGNINSDLAPTYNGLNLGTVSSLTLNGGEVKTYKNGPGDVLGAQIFYSIYPTSGSAGSFSNINLPFFQNLPTPGDQVWQEALAGVDVIQGLAPGDYYLQAFWQVNTNQGNIFDSNAPLDVRAQFTVAQPVSTVPTMSEWGLILLGLTVVAFGTVMIWKKRFSPAV